MKHKKNYFVADEGDGLYNVFSYWDFESDGYLFGYSGQEGYHLSDFDIVYECNTFAEAERWIDKQIAKKRYGRV